MHTKLRPSLLFIAALTAQACTTGTLKEINNAEIELAPLTVDCSGVQAVVGASWFDISNEPGAMYRVSWRQNSQSWEAADTDDFNSALNRTFNETKGVMLDVRVESADQVRVSNTRSIRACQSGSTNQPPTAEAGPNQAIQLPANSVTLDGSASVDSDGDIGIWSWSKVSGPNSPVFDSGSSAQTSVTGLQAGVYVFALNVFDNDGANAEDTVQVTVTPETPSNQAPVARAGNDVTSASGTVVNFDGSSSSDSDGTIVSWEWDFGDGTSASGATATHFYITGTYIATLTVTDNEGSIDSDTRTITMTATQVAGLNPHATGRCVGSNIVYDIAWTAEPAGRYWTKIDRRVQGSSTFGFATWVGDDTVYTDNVSAAATTVEYRVQAYSEDLGYTAYEYTGTLTAPSCP